MTNYNNLLDGAKGLLGDCVRLLSNTRIDYVIVGGWSPLILNSGVIRHPGTHDVDILFKEGKKERELEDIFKLFLQNGFYSSAKHNFQLLKIIQVCSREFVYNVDFLHSSDNHGTEDMFADHLKLPVPVDEYRDSSYIEMSIKAPNSEVIFVEHLFDEFEYKFELPDGNSIELPLRLINEAGLIVTKTDSMKQAKRKRDSFDIYLAVKQARDYENLLTTFKKLKKINPRVFDTLYSVKEMVKNGFMISNILDFMPQGTAEGSSSCKVIIKRDLENFLTDVGLEEKAKPSYL